MFLLHSECLDERLLRYLRLRCICSCDGDLGAGELRSRL